jgi:hypothetical protein
MKFGGINFGPWRLPTFLLLISYLKYYTNMEFVQTFEVETLAPPIV